jgi:dihydroflavonol-4-reductase
MLPLVTGGTGLVGTHLLLALAHEHKKIRAVYREKDRIIAVKKWFDYCKKNDLFERIEWIEGDITDVPFLMQAFNGVQEVYHCAGFVSFDNTKEKSLFKINQEGTANMVNVALEHAVEKFCYVSSIAALGSTNNNELITEDTDWNPEKIHDAYAFSKYEGELEVWRGIQEGLNAVIVNPGVIIGACYSENDIQKLFRFAAKKNPFYSTGVTGYVSVNDVVKAMILLMKHRIFNQRFCLVAENLSFKDILTSLSTVYNTTPPKYKLSPTKAWLFVFLGTLLFKLKCIKTPFSYNFSKVLFKKSYYNNQKIKTHIEFKFEPIEVTLQEAGKFYKNP